MKTTNTIDRNETRTARDTLINTFKATRENGPQETVKALVAALGYDAAVVAVAELINGVGDWDARVETRRRTWAAGIENAASRDELAAIGIYSPGEIHPAHIDQLGAYMMKYEPETAPEAPAEEIPEEETETAEEETTPAALQLGDVVEISGAATKCDNGLYFVEQVPGGACWSGSQYCLKKIGKTGKVLKSGSTIAWWPMRDKGARLSRPEGVALEGVAEWFRETAAQKAEQIESETRRGWTVSDAERGRLDELRQACARFASVSAPAQKEPEKGIRFYWNGIKVDGGELIKCGYSAQNDGSVTIYAHDYGAQLPREYFTVRNYTDVYTDYFDTDGADVAPDHPLYKYVRHAAMKAATRGDRVYIEKTRANIEKAEQQPNKTRFVLDWIEREKKEVARRAARLAEFDAMKDPGQPTAEDLQAVADLKTAEESARIEAEKAARIEEREKYLKQRSAGREYIETVQAAHPVEDGAPVVEIPFSELPAFHAWTESRDRTAVTIKTDGHGRTVSREEKVIEPRRRLLLSVAAADEILKHFDGEIGTGAGYYKTDFVITWTGDDGEPNTYTGRYDIGDGDGGLVEHVRALGRWDLDHAQTDEARQAAQSRIDTAAFLARYLPGGEIVSVEFAPWVLSALAAKKKKEEEARERIDDTLATVEMLTDEQLIQAVNLAPYADPEKRDVGRFFLQQLAQRDEKKAMDVFRRWIRGEEAPLE